jgi:short-subunit dehydrogenase
MNGGRKFWGSKTLLVVTGASQGIGQTIATQFSSKVGQGSVALLIARSESGLKETAAIIKKTSPHVTVQVSSFF